MIGEIWTRPNNPRIAILEAEQKFGGYSFCHLGRYKGREAKKQKRKAMIGENERAQITPELLFWKPNRSLGVILSVTWADIKEKKQRSRKGRQWLGKMNAPKRIAILEAEQKFGGYSFCHLGRYKGREAKKQKRKAMIGENERAQITPELLFWKPNRSLGVILSVTWADIKEEKQRSRKGRQWLGKMNAPK